MNYTSIEEIKKEFDIQTDKKVEIKSELRKKLANSHPDKVGEKDFDSTKFNRIKNALDFVNNGNQELTTTEQVTDLIKIVRDLTNNTSKDLSEKQLSDSLDSYYKERKEALLFPKISLSVVTAILSFIWLFPQTVEDHPILSRYISFENELATMIWLTLLIYTGFFWILISRKERREKVLSKRLKTDRTQNEILTDFKKSESSKKFMKSNLTGFILRGYSFRRQSSVLSLFMGRPGIDQETAENLSNYIIKKAESKGLIEEIQNEKSLDDYYRWK